jgi:pimeloyl-ACP methyl ester carboxylesterase
MPLAEISVADRLTQVLDHLGIERAHFAGSMLADFGGFAQAHRERIASLTLVCPPRLDPGLLRALGARLLIIAGDQGRPAAMVRDAALSLPDAEINWLSEYFSPPWADVVADRTAEIEKSLLEVAAKEGTQQNVGVHGGTHGAVAEITYHIQGQGLPLVLLPLSWRPRNGSRCCRASASGFGP